MTDFPDLMPAELATLKAQHVGTMNANSAIYSGPACPRCDEPWPCSVSRLIRMVERGEVKP